MRYICRGFCGYHPDSLQSEVEGFLNSYSYYQIHTVEYSTTPALQDGTHVTYNCFIVLEDKNYSTGG